jgi:hypothetical protein
MPFALCTRRITLLVLAAYVAAHTLGTVLHEHLHVHAGDQVCCHAHDHSHAGHQHAPHGAAAERTADPNGVLNGLPTLDEGCIVCRIAGQKVLPAVAVTTDASAGICPDAIPAPAAMPRTIAARLAHSRAPPSAV